MASMIMLQISAIWPAWSCWPGLIPTIYFWTAQEGVGGRGAQQAVHILSPRQLMVEHAWQGEQAAAMSARL